MTRFHERAALAGQQGLFMPQSSWRAPSGFPQLRGRGVKQLGLDVETRDPDLKTKGPGVRRGSKIIGLSIAVEGGPKLYFPTGHDGGNLDHDVVMSWARDELNALDCEVVGANLGYDLDFLAEEGVTFPLVKTFHDVIVAEPLLDENKVGEYNLEAIAMEHLKEGKEETLLMEAGRALGLTTKNQIKSNLWRLPANLVGPYAEADADLPLRILPFQMKRLEAEELLPVYEIERRLIPILVAMRRRGIPVNADKVAALRTKLVALLADWRAELKRLAGPSAELMEVAPLARALAERGIIVPRTPKNDEPSITKPMLERYQGDELVRVILNGRKVNTLINTFIDGQILGHMVRGRVHPTFKQIKGDDGGTVGRLSGATPNMQFIPARDSGWQEEPLAMLVREVFEPESGETWQRDDASQIEYRLLTHYAVGQGAEEAREKYRNDKTTSFHNMVGGFLGADLKDKNIYRRIKVTNFCKVYGGGPDKVALTAGCSLDEAVRFTLKYDTDLPFVKSTYESAARWAGNRGYVVTILNRRQRFPFWGPARYRDQFPAKLFRSREEAVAHYVEGKVKYRGYDVGRVERIGTYTALCRKLQVSSADLMKKAMVDAEEAGITCILGPFLLTNHDELGSSIPPTRLGDEAGIELTRIMEDAVKLKVPVLVERSRGASWGNCS